MNRIVILVDFTPVSSLALQHVKLLAEKKPMEVVLLHVAPAGQQSSEQEVREKIKKFGQLLTDSGIAFLIQIDFGDFFEVIGENITKSQAELAIVGTHGITVKGSLAGSNIMKLLNVVKIPALIIQLQSSTPTEGYLKVLLPITTKINESEVVREVGIFAAVYNSAIHILSFYNEQNEQPMRTSSNLIADGLKNLGSKVELDMDRSEKNTESYFKSIVELSDIEEAELIVLMISNKFSGSFSPEDQENILLNRLGKPILCI